MGLRNNSHNGGTRCPTCREQNTSVKDSRPSPEGYTRRRRVCNSCGSVWSTLEVPEQARVTVDLSAALVRATDSMNRAIGDFNALRRAIREATK